LDEDRVDLRIPKTLTLGAAVAALTIALPAAAASADDAASPGGLGYADPDGPSVFADGSTLLAPTAGLLGDVVRVHGTVPNAQAGDRVVLQHLTPAGWASAATATVDGAGAYDATWTPDHSGHTKLRALPAGGDATAASAPGDARDVTVFHRTLATWYGPGFYGRRTACGRRLTRSTLGVAHKSLPCGTLVELYKDGRTITVPVIDRGPFRPGTSYDLTAATAQALGVTATTVLGAVRAAPAAAGT
jgi:rare lipoprotein A